LKVLFVLSGNSPVAGLTGGSEKEIIKNPKHQGDSLIEMGYDIDYYYIVGKGIAGYLKNLPGIRRCIKTGGYDLVHAHYSLSAIAASLAGTHKMVVSLMGSDTYSNYLMLFLIRLFCRFRWNKVIVKSEAMKKKINCRKAVLLPNGVNILRFRPVDKTEARKRLALPEGKIILFAADPARPEKNYKLAEEAFRRLGRNDAVLLPVFNSPYNMMPSYMNASDVLLLTSLWEGSVNVVKEAMACNLPVVSTDVGDVRNNVEGLKGCFITTFDPDEIADKLNTVLDQNMEVRGTERIMELGLDTDSVNKRLIEIYKSVTGYK